MTLHSLTNLRRDLLFIVSCCLPDRQYDKMGKVPQNEVVNCSPPWRETTLWEDEMQDEQWKTIGDAT